MDESKINFQMGDVVIVHLDHSHNLNGQVGKLVDIDTDPWGDMLYGVYISATKHTVYLSCYAIRYLTELERLIYG